MRGDKPVCIFGEVLFDNFPDGSRVLGGAPFNVAWHLQAFGEYPQLLSRVGRDPEGEQVRSAMQSWGLQTRFLQTDPVHPTGRVAVSFESGEPAYNIVAQCAYDYMETVPVDRCKLLYHGTLAARAATSADTLRKLRSSRPETVFIDVNLRQPWWEPKTVHEWLQGAHWVKLSEEELSLLSDTPASADPGREFLRRYLLRGLIVTRGSKGAELLLASGDTLEVTPDGATKVTDTVGAGDAFASVILMGLLNDWPMPDTLQRAQEFATAMVGRRGATVEDPGFYREVISPWRLSG